MTNARLVVYTGNLVKLFLRTKSNKNKLFYNVWFFYATIFCNVDQQSYCFFFHCDFMFLYELNFFRSLPSLHFLLLTSRKQSRKTLPQTITLCKQVFHILASMPFISWSELIINDDQLFQTLALSLCWLVGTFNLNISFAFQLHFDFNYWNSKKKKKKIGK